MQYLTAEDVAEFDRKFPSASSFLASRNLQRERECLTAEYERIKDFPTEQKRAVWVKNRLDWFAEVDEAMKPY